MDDDEFYRWYGPWESLSPPEVAADGCEQLWVRRDGAGPWLADLGLTPHDGTTWISKRDERIRLPFDRATFVATDGIRYLRPEVSLHMKAKLLRSKDDVDLDSTLPLLRPEDVDWLRGTIALTQPDHPWLAVLDQRRSTIRRGSPPHVER